LSVRVLSAAASACSGYCRLLPARYPAAARTGSRQAAYQHALAAGFDRAFLVASGIELLIAAVAITVIRIRRADLSGS
jgi:hypothetical protein